MEQMNVPAQPMIERGAKIEIGADLAADREHPKAPSVAISHQNSACRLPDLSTTWLLVAPARARDGPPQESPAISEVVPAPTPRDFRNSSAPAFQVTRRQREALHRHLEAECELPSAQSHKGESTDEYPPQCLLPSGRIHSPVWHRRDHNVQFRP